MKTQQLNPNHTGFARNEGPREYQRLEQTILDTQGVACSVLVKPGIISIRAESYPDFLLAKQAIRFLAGSRAIIQG